MEKLVYVTGGREWSLDSVWPDEVIAPQYPTRNLANGSELKLKLAYCHTVEQKFYVANKFRKMLPDLSADLRNCITEKKY